VHTFFFPRHSEAVAFSPFVLGGIAWGEATLFSFFGSDTFLPFEAVVMFVILYLDIFFSVHHRYHSFTRD
jgi:hypothetical protein